MGEMEHETLDGSSELRRKVGPQLEAYHCFTAPRLPG